MMIFSLLFLQSSKDYDFSSNFVMWLYNLELQVVSWKQTQKVDLIF